MMMEAAHSSETPVITYNPTQCPNPKQDYLNACTTSVHKEETPQSLGNSVHKIWWTVSPAVLAEGSERHKHNLKYH